MWPSLGSCLCSFQKCLESLIRGSLHLVNFGAAFEDFECRHAVDSASLRNFGSCVDIALHHDELWEFCHLCYKNWANTLAWWAPSGSEVNDEGLVATLQCVELVHGFDVVFVVCHCENLVKLKIDYKRNLADLFYTARCHDLTSQKYLQRLIIDDDAKKSRKILRA